VESPECSESTANKGNETRSRFNLTGNESGRRFAWFVGLWAAGVAAVALLSLAIKLAIA
jgi:hypothetical protein